MGKLTSVKTCNLFLRDFNRATTPETHVLIFISCFIYFLFLLLSSFSPPLSCVSNTFQLSHNNTLTSNADSNEILLTCIISAPLLLYPSLFPWASVIVSLLSTNTSLTFLNFALFRLTSHYLPRMCSEQCLEMCITSTFCVCLLFLMYCLLYSSIVSCFG